MARIALRTDAEARLSVADLGVRRVGMTAQTRVDRLPDYEGPYEVTPSRSAQTVHTSGKSLIGDITVNPIPSNYGLVTWNGSVLTVS